MSRGERSSSGEGADPLAVASPSPFVRTLRVALAIAAAWCVFTTTHELGHVPGGWLGGGRLTALELRPWRLPHSFHDPDPWPLLTLWAGPLLGVLLPAAVAAGVQRPLMTFVASFCLLANGTYLAAGWLAGDSELDTTKLLAAGAGRLPLAAYSCVTIVTGYVVGRRSLLSLWTTGADRPVA